MNENERIKARLTELANRAYERGFTTCSDFLNRNEISLLKTMHVSAPYVLYGGYDCAERCIAAFGENPCIPELPVACLAIAPVQQKFADKLTHRDVLGALMHLGIERHTLGDILLCDNTAYLFCLDTIAPYILQNLTRIKHTTVQCTAAEALPTVLTEPPPVTEVIVPSVRADAVIGAVYKLSRSEAARLFAAEKVFVNSVLTGKESQPLKEGDVVSVRGHGRFIFEEILRTTKKNRSVAAVRIYR